METNDFAARYNATAPIAEIYEQQIGPQSIGAHVPLKIDYVNDAPDVREYLVNLRRDLLRKVKQLDELIGRIDYTKSHT